MDDAKKLWLYTSPQPCDSAKLSKVNQKQQRRNHEIVEEEGKDPKNKHNIKHKIRGKKDLKQRGVLYLREELIEVNHNYHEQCPLELGKMAALNGIYESDRRTESQFVLRENREAKIYTFRRIISDETEFPRIR